VFGIFQKFLGIVQGSTLYRPGNFKENRCSEKKVTELFSKFFLGGPKPQGDPEPAKLQGESLEGVEFYKAVKRSLAYIAPNSRYKGSKFDLLGPLAAKQ